MTSLTQYVVYERPADYPDGYVLRLWVVDANGPVPGEARCFDTLEKARLAVPDGFIRLPRAADDDPSIVEVWT